MKQEHPAHQHQPSRPRLLRASLVLGGAVVLGSAVLWVSRENEIATGLPCEARGTFGCAIDGPIYFVIGAMLGALIAVVGLLLAAWLGRRGRATWPPLAVAGLVWAWIFTILLSGTRS